MIQKNTKRRLVRQGQLLLYIEKNEEGVTLLRCYGDSPVVALPDTVEGCVLTQIGDYCFADSARAHRCDEASGGTYRELYGDYLQEIFLPDTVRKLGSLACYNCKSLRRLGFGAALTEVGSDVFMNCRSLGAFQVSADMQQETGLKQLLAQRMTDMEVTFVMGNDIVGKLFYPEYEEDHDEIGPAHIFAMSIHGEGFRARQCFQNGRLSLAAYDEIFEQACAEESKKTLCRLAADRLAYPVNLSGQAGERYRRFLAGQQSTLVELLVKQRDIAAIREFACKEILNGDGMMTAAWLAAETEWVQGAAELLTFNKELAEQKNGEDQYAFEEW